MANPTYDDIAEWYDERVRAGALLHDLVTPSLFDLIGRIAAQRICDLACGQGVIARQLALMGASVTGIDVSEKLLEIARRDEEAQTAGITYIQDDAQSLDKIDDSAFDGVVCNMALMNIPDLEATFRTVHRVLRSHGWFVFSITHPCFETSESRWVGDSSTTVRREVGAYFEEGYWRSDNPDGVRGKIGDHHRMLSTYLNTAAGVGFVLKRIAEPRATGDIANRVPGYREVPPALVVRCEKPTER